MEILLPFEWEDAAFQEVLQGFKASWRSKHELFIELSKENKSIALEEINLPNLISRSRELIDLFERILHDLILREPYLYRMLAYITLSAEDREKGRSFFNQYMEKGRELIDAYNDFLHIDILTGSSLAEQKGLSGIPLHVCFAGQVLEYLFQEAEKRRNSDFAIPRYVRLIWEKKGPVLEFVNKADYGNLITENQIDDILYEAINNAQKDRRQELFFGQGFNPKHKVIKRWQNEEKEIPFQLLPKYAGLVKKRAKGLPKVETIVTGNDGKVRAKRDHDFTSVEMVLLEAVLDKTPGKIKPVKMPFPAFIKKQITWRLGKEWDDESTEALKKERHERIKWQHIQSDEQDIESIFRRHDRISKVEMEQSGGSLDDFIDNEDKAGRRIDFPDDKGSLDPESELTGKEDFSLQMAILAEAHKDERFMRIVESEGRRSAADQRYFGRKINKIREEFGIKS